MIEIADRRNIQGVHYWEHTILEINVIIVTLRRVIHLVNMDLDSIYGYIHEIEK